jgi:hypothetical protein
MFITTSLNISRDDIGAGQFILNINMCFSFDCPETEKGNGRGFTNVIPHLLTPKARRDTNFITSLMRWRWEGKNLFLSFFKLGITRIPRISRPYVYFREEGARDWIYPKGYGKHVVLGLDAAKHLVKSDGNRILRMKNMH